MFTLLRRGRKGKAADTNDRTYSPFAGSPEVSRNRVVAQSVNGDVVEDDDEEHSPGEPRGATSYFEQGQRNDYDEDEDEEEHGEDAENTPLLPIFSAAHLDRLPMYNITHAIRLLIVQKCETTLSWDQLRSPQISQFLVKPIQSQIRTNHFNRATLCALIANCLQFQKEAEFHPGNVGVSKTRALISQLLAMRLVKEFSVRELIDALSYDYDPLQGMSPPPTGRATPGWATPAFRDGAQPRVQRGARVSTIEIAIRAQAKRFLAHPLVVQHLEAIWAGTIVFHSEADQLHRKPQHRTVLGYGATDAHSPSALPADSILSRKAHETRVNRRPTDQPLTRRSVTLYDPRDASLFKLSRLRVPRYRQLFSTLSFATMLGLFIAVLVDRSKDITPLEVVFWFWSIGYMLDEVIGFTEQGFGLYILSFWNAFDLGILLLFVIYYVLRLYGILLAEDGKHRIASMAYDVLASTAVLLFPRLFSVLDHYRYFSQLLIAFRMMAQDLIAILVLILISCSGFFVAFTLSFSDERTDGKAVAYSLFQILMGFTPAAWDKWSGYNMLGKAIMSAFLIICHFLIVTILITVLTNSFMAIVQNANEEHQFLFAVNTISMVKSDALFSYIAPTNVIGWICSPLRYVMPFRQFVKLNRTIIKVTHFPVLFIICGYERIILSRLAYEPTDLIEFQASSQPKPLAFSMNKAPDLFSPGNRLREPSIISHRKDTALDEVFRRPFRGSTMRTTVREMEGERRNSTNVVDKWMDRAENEGGASPPIEQPRSVLERLEHRRPRFGRSSTVDKLRQMKSRDFSVGSRSVMSDPDLLSITAPRRPKPIEEEEEPIDMSTETLPQETDADAGDEDTGESDHVAPGLGESAVSVRDRATSAEDDDDDTEELFATPTAGKSPMMQLSSAARAHFQDSPDVIQSAAAAYQAKPHAKRAHHDRNASSGTIMFAPQYQQAAEDSSTTSPFKTSKPGTAKHTNSNGATTPTATYLLPGQQTPGLRSGQQTPRLAAGQRTPKHKPPQQSKIRPIMPPRQKTAPTGIGGNVGMSFLDIARRAQREPSFNARALDLASEIGDNRFAPSGGMDAGGISGMPASFSEQMMRERERERQIERQRDEERRRSEEEEKGMVNRIMLARMHTLEEGFREVLKEIKDLSKGGGSSRRESEIDAPAHHRHKPERSQLDTRSSVPSQSGNAPKTPVTRSDSQKHKKSQRKLQRRGTKGKEQDRPGSAVSVQEKASPQSIKSIIERPSEEEREAEAGASRPMTAVRTPESRGRDDQE